MKLTKHVQQWFKDRNLDKAESHKQMLKLTEEVGELAAALVRNDTEETIDAIGDIQVVLIGLCLQLGLDYETTLETAYEVIKDRKGKLIDGVFVKEEDLQNE